MSTERPTESSPDGGNRQATSPGRQSSEGRNEHPIPSRRRAMTTDFTYERRLQNEEGLRRRSGASRENRIPSLAPRTTLAERTRGKFTLGGPDDSRQLRDVQQTFVHPAYADLNPSYDQSNNTKPVWSLAKPLPRVVRPGMVPTKGELLENRMNAEVPAENSKRLGLDVDPNEIENGRIEKSADLRKVAAQVTDARIQRENNFLSTILSGEGQNRQPYPGGGGSSLRRTRTGSLTSQRGRGYSQAPAYTDALPVVKEGPQETSSDGTGDLADETVGRGDDDDTGDDTTNVEHAAGSNTKVAGGDSEAHAGLEPFPADDELLEGPRSLEMLRLDQAAYPEDLHPLVQDMVEEEIHNNHTTWSVIRTHHREALAESLAVFIQLTIGFCADLSVTVANAGNPNTTDWAWGFATMIGIYISGGVSGAHLNPSVTMMLWFYRGFPKRKMPEYFLAQFIGAFCAALAAYGIYYVSIQNWIDTGGAGRGTAAATTDIINSFVTSQRDGYVNPGTALFNELMGTMCLATVVLALGDDQNAPPGAGMNSLIIGLVITCLSMAFANQTGAALNPSRDFGPRLALLALGYTSKIFTNPYWFYGPWAGSLLGAFLGAFLYDFMIFTGGESPVNYPLERTQRAMYKGRLKWKRRLRVGKREVEQII